jgi:type IX secretion system PorP/SprF family membrane protein
MPFRPHLLRSFAFAASLAVLSPALRAQQDPLLTQFRFLPAVTNPAAAGSERGLDLFAAARMQWVGLSGAPQSQFVTGHLPLYGLSSGVGFTVWNDLAGLGRTTGFMASYAYRLELGRGSTLALGVSAGGLQVGLDGERIRTPDGSYEGGIIDHADDLLPITPVQGTAFDVGAGIWFQSGTLRAGAAVGHLLEPDVTLPLGNGTTSIRMKRQFHVTAAYEIGLGGNLALEPGVSLRMGPSATALDANLLLFVRDNMWVGTTFRSNLSNGSDAVGGMAGTRLGQRFRLGYAYDHTLHALNQVSGGSHELILGYRVAVERPKQGKRINNPRYLHY